MLNNEKLEQANVLLQQASELIESVRNENGAAGRELSLALTNIQQGQLWLLPAAPKLS